MLLSLGPVTSFQGLASRNASERDGPRNQKLELDPLIRDTVAPINHVVDPAIIPKKAATRA
jgi:hypothetical protein